MAKFIFILYFIFTFSSLKANLNGEKLFHFAEEDIRHSRFTPALVRFNQAAMIFQREHLDSSFANTQNRIAAVEIKLSREDVAVFVLMKNEAFILRNLKSETDLLCECYDLLGDYYMLLSDAEEAAKYYFKSFTIRKNKFGMKDIRTAISLSKIAGYHNFKINVDSAILYSSQAYSIYKTNYPKQCDPVTIEIIDEYAYASKIYYGRGKENLDIGVEKARKLYFDALAVCQKWSGTDCIEYAELLKSIGNTYTDQTLNHQMLRKDNDFVFNEAEKYYNQSLKVVQSKLPAGNLQLSTIYFVKGLLREYNGDKGHHLKCIPFYDAAIQALFPYKVDVVNLSETELANCTFKYDLMNLLTVESASLIGSYNENNILDHLLRAYSNYQKQLFLWKKINEEFRSPYANRLIAIYNGNLFLNACNASWLLYENSNDQKYLNDIFRISELSKKSLRDKPLIETNNIDQVKLKVRKTTINEVQNKLKDKSTLLIEYFGQNTLIGISKDTSIFIRIKENINTDSLVNCIKIQLNLNDAKNYSGTSNLIYKTYLSPLLESFKNKFTELIIIPDENLRKISFAALNTDSVFPSDFRKIDYLIRKMSVRYQTSATDFVNEAECSENFNGKMIAFAPKFKDKSALPFTENLLHQLKNDIQGSFYVGTGATLDQFINNTDNYSILHIGTHGEFGENESIDSKLFFNGNNEHDSHLTVDSVFHLKKNSNLTIIAACNTNNGKYEYGEGAINFTRAFLTVGSHSTISTLWSVDDKMTNNVLLDVYQSLLDGKNKSAALNMAQLIHINKTKSSIEANPNFWAGLIFTGSDGTVTLFKKEKNQPWLYGFFVLVLVIAIWYFNKGEHRS